MLYCTRLTREKIIYVQGSAILEAETKGNTLDSHLGCGRDGEEPFLAQDWPLKIIVQPSENLSMAAPPASADQEWN